MLVLLPPSEGKTAPAGGDPIDLASLSHPSLTEARRRVGDALAKVSGQRNALKVLDVGASLAAEVARNTTVWTNPCDAAARVYAGVLYDAASMSSWDDATLTRAASRLRIVSALWGAVSPADPIPAYRLSMGTTLGRLGGLAAFWRKRMADELDTLADGGLVVDCRSASYIAAYHPSAPWVTVRVMREQDGKRSVVSHMAKRTRGLLAAHLMRADEAPKSAQDLADAAAGMIGNSLVDVALTAKAKAPDELTLVIAG
ncbi:YaaA family protein [Demequina capsici]|uniref:Peroxide stress protein YaaA n=1 Tax=Demequina capsici TaxID=3075620 RepID=A0AA96FC27_9MICO|nr:peroxide stress protein YaaA [Demequina sp. OYTSA14]WNM25550.1 peroxide stress protein YaaA [Demequina sp. OYTSA14]